MSTMTLSRSRRLVGAVTAASLLGAALGEWAHLPAGALLGGLLVSVAAALSLSVHVPCPRPLYLAAQGVLGTALCASFTPASWAALAEHGLIALPAVVGVVAVAQAVALALAFLTGIEIRTATLGLMPGGASAMIALSEDLGADTRVVTLLQYVRLAAVILITAAVGTQVSAAPDPQAAALLPEHPALLTWAVSAFVALAGGVLGVWLRLPAGVFIGPVLLGAPLTWLGLPVGAWPPGVLFLCLWALGTRVGSHFDSTAVHELRRAALSALAAALAVVGGCALLAAAWSSLGDVDLLTTYFATSPGGADSVLAIALETHARLALVLAVQVARLLLVFLLVPLLLRRRPGRR